MILRLDGCEHDRCERHRALGDWMQARIIKALTATVLSFTLAGGGDFIHIKDLFGRGGKAPGGTTSADHRAYSARDYMPVRLAQPIRGVGRHADEVFLQFPARSSHGPFVTWTMLVRNSGRIDVVGKYENYLREFWTVEGLCRSPKGLASLWNDSYPYGMYFDIWPWAPFDGSELDLTTQYMSASWHVKIGESGRELIECYNLPEETCQQWRELARHITNCKETIAATDSRQN